MRSKSVVGIYNIPTHSGTAVIFTVYAGLRVVKNEVFNDLYVQILTREIKEFCIDRHLRSFKFCTYKSLFFTYKSIKRVIYV